MKEGLQGIVFDIRRFSTHDGNGIRTTMFLKGCSLSCVWCHNPEGIRIQARPIYFHKTCIGCRSCIEASKCGGVTMEKEGILLHPEEKEDWNKIINSCPTGAISMDSRIISVEQAMAELLKDRAFFKFGGGVTFSGGEPLLQADFVLELLKRLKKEEIHTAIETALHVPMENLKKVLPFLDLVYADFKIADSVLHKKYTGVNNKKIKENLKFLLSSEYRDRVIIRTPLIPGITTEERNIREICRYISRIYPEISYELLNWNPLAEAKYHLVNRKFCFEKNPERYSKEQMKSFAAIAQSGGVKNVIIDV